MKRKNIYKGYIGKGYTRQSEFDHRFACWAVNHNGWAKAKKFNKRMAKRRLRQVHKRDDETDERDL